MDPRLRKALVQACSRLAIPVATLASGGVNDAKLLDNASVPRGMVFMRNEHG